MTHLTGQLRLVPRGGVALLCGALLLAGVLAAALVGVAGAKSAAGIDHAYGHEGVVQVTGPGMPQTTSSEGTPSAYLYVRSLAAAADGGAYVLGEESRCTASVGCSESTFLERYESDGARDETFGTGNFVSLPPEGATKTSVLADGAGRALVAGVVGKEVAIRRFTATGRPDPGFGGDGVVRIPCACAVGQLHLLNESGGRTLVDIDTPIRFYERGTMVRLVRLESDGSVDRSYGRRGTVQFTVHGPGEPRTVVRGAGDATLVGGSGGKGCCGPRRVWLWRVSGKGRVDGRFSRAATRSLRQLSAINRFPTLAAIVPAGRGGLALLGSTSKTGVGFFLRLRDDGRLARGFGEGGLLSLPFAVESAVGGTGGATFAIGYDGSGGYKAFRILADGELDPAFGGAHGVDAPLSGIRIHATSLGDGRVMVTDNGNSFCRSACTSRPAIARFLE